MSTDSKHTGPTQARNDNTDETTDADTDGELANPGPVPVEAEDAADMGEGRKINPDVD